MTAGADSADGFVDLSGWGTGLPWLNGFLELDRPGPDLPLRDRPDRGRTTLVTRR
ncbi:hypothetical protein [Streptomyces erythrochromogenes]|uniref:hypothetical protein n=1 Tax=Streptomyces erythrochromogenes TaxID=285574 RepID=UPI0036FB10B6